jgi:hypothetical protein
MEMARTLLPPGDEHPHLVLCGVKSEAQLHTVLRRLNRIGVASRSFSDTDLGGRLTAIATAPVKGALRACFRRYQCLREESNP